MGPNKGQASRRREHRQLRVEAERVLALEFESDAFSKKMLKLTQDCEKALEDMVTLAVSLAGGFGTEADRPVLNRLGQILFVRIASAYNTDLKVSVADYLQRNPSSSMHDLLLAVVTLEVKRALLAQARGNVLAADPNGRLSVLFHDLGRGFVDIIRKWKEEGSTPATLPPKHFEVLGTNFSVASRSS